MGRKNKQKIDVSIESIDYVKSLIKFYPEMKKICDELEQKKPLLLKRCGLDIEAFHMEVEPSERQFQGFRHSVRNQEKIQNYADCKEKIYLLEHGIWMLTGTMHEVALSLFLQRKGWDDVMKELNISRMTLCRARNDAILHIAEFIDEYMFWKVETLFG